MDEEVHDHLLTEFGSEDVSVSGAQEERPCPCDVCENTPWDPSNIMPGMACTPQQDCQRIISAPVMPQQGTPLFAHRPGPSLSHSDLYCLALLSHLELPPIPSFDHLPPTPQFHAGTHGGLRPWTMRTNIFCVSTEVAFMTHRIDDG